MQAYLPKAATGQQQCPFRQIVRYPDFQQMHTSPQVPAVADWSKCRHASGDAAGQMQ